ncbi:hypothetical protein [Nostoc sp. CHAB 5715]|uniref:hypothetical protein n=1 Tax=Nostoc sp. CHAB 5715 TaxID=2780400 RepID=UPI001E5BF00E|nr:hypothetical protein [Nostoc sp. CHAB 5715]
MLHEHPDYLAQKFPLISCPVIPILYEDAQNIKRTALRVHQSLTVGNPPTALVHQVRQERQE